MKTSLLPIVLSLPVASQAVAQSFDYPDFTGATNLVLNEDAQIVGSTLRVTNAFISERGSVYRDEKVSVAGGFDTTFTFRFTSPSAGGGDGMAFIVQDDPAGTAALGNHASAMGYGGFSGTPTVGIDNSLVVEIDSYANGSTADLSDNHLSVHTGGAGDNSAHEDFSLGRYDTGVAMSNGTTHTIRVHYVPGTLDVYYDDLTTPVLSIPYDLTTGGTYLNAAPAGGLSLTDGEAYVGFTAGNGGAWENHEVLSWTWGAQSGISVTCDPANDHYLGDSVKLDSSSFGSGVGSDLHVEALDGPPGEFGFLLVSPAADLDLTVFNGVLCLSVPQGRYNPLAATNQGLPELNSLGQFDATGVLQNLVGTATSTGGSGFDVPTALPFTPAGQVIAPGDTYYFQLWYRDQVAPLPNPGSSANFSDVIAVTFP